MRTKAAIKSHPIHPMLVGFPITFFTACLGCDIIGRVLDNPAWWTMGKHFALAGVISALIAAVPGLIDLLFAIPPRSSAKKRGTIHAVVNVTGTALFVAAWYLRGPAEQMPTTTILLLEVAGFTVINVGGWLGGTLVYRNFVGPEHRYADGGHWNEERVSNTAGQPFVVAGAEELQIDQMKLVHVDDKRIVLARTKDGWAAFDDRCTHRGASLADGVLIDGKVQCLWHGSRFDCHTGQVLCGPAQARVSTYRVDVVDGQVRLHLSRKVVDGGIEEARVSPAR